MIFVFLLLTYFTLYTSMSCSSKDLGSRWYLRCCPGLKLLNQCWKGYLLSVICHMHNFVHLPSISSWFCISCETWSKVHNFLSLGVFTSNEGLPLRLYQIVQLAMPQYFISKYVVLLLLYKTAGENSSYLGWVGTEQWRLSRGGLLGKQLNWWTLLGIVLSQLCPLAIFWGCCGVIWMLRASQTLGYPSRVNRKLASSCKINI